MLCVLAVAAGYTAWHLNRGWVPLDEGSLAQAAQRVLTGELPHRDFDDVYTGGLAYLNAAAFRLLGPTLWSMRLALFAAFLAWVPAVYYVASRFTRPLMSAGITLLAVAWSVPNYPAPMPSWYNLFLATAGIAALLRYLEDGRERWLVMAGVFGGLSFLVKVVGLYYVAGVLLFLVFQAHASSVAAADDAPARGKGQGYAAFVTGALLLFVAALYAIVRGRPSAPDLIQFMLPGAAVAALLARQEWTMPAGTSVARARMLAGLVAPFALGLLLPIGLFLIPYARSGALGAFGHGVFILPAKRLAHAAHAPPLRTMLALMPAAAVTAAVAWPRPLSLALDRRALILIGAGLAVVLAASGSVDDIYQLVLHGIRGLVPVLAIAAVALLARDRDPSADARRRRARLMAPLCVMAVCTLVQFPFTVAIYFCYVAPLVAITAVALVAYLDRPVTPALPAMGVAFCLAFALLWLNTSPLNDMDVRHEPYPEVRPMRLDRAGLLVPLWQAGQYEATVEVIRQHARGEYIWASPDVPQLYFLSGFRNPTRSLFEFFDDTTGRSDRVLAALEAHQVNLVVLNISPQFSPRISVALYRQLAKRYPNSALVEPYLIKWRE